MSSLPKSLNIAGINYTVEETPTLIHSDELWGRVDYYRSHIQVEQSLSDDRKQQILTHEMTHAIFLEAGYKEQDEDMINRVGIVLHQVLKNNDFSFLQGKPIKDGERENDKVS